MLFTMVFVSIMVLPFSNMLFSQVASPFSSPRPLLDPQLAPQLGIKGSGPIPYIPLNPPSLPGAVA